MHDARRAKAMNSAVDSMEVSTAAGTATTTSFVAAEVEVEDDRLPIEVHRESILRVMRPTIPFPSLPYFINVITLHLPNTRFFRLYRSSQIIALPSSRGKLAGTCKTEPTHLIYPTHTVKSIYFNALPFHPNPDFLNLTSSRSE